MVFLPRFYFTLVTAILLALASTLVPNGMTASLVLTLLLTCAVLADVALVPRDALRVKRNVPPILKQAQLFQVELTLFNKCERASVFQILDSPPIDFTGASKTITVRLPPRRETLQTYSLKSYRRGSFSFGSVYYRSARSSRPIASRAFAAAASLLAPFSTASPGRSASSSAREKSTCPRACRSCPT